jgi:hypothetical protein
MNICLSDVIITSNTSSVSMKLSELPIINSDDSSKSAVLSGDVAFEADRVEKSIKLQELVPSVQ